MARRVVVGVLGCVAVFGACVAPARAQGVLDDLYGQGVHAYYDGDFETSAAWLSQAVEGGTRDPRAFYFLGLAHWKLGDQDSASAEFRRGAEIETEGTEQFFPIDRSLARVQGEARLAIEKARRQARADADARAVARARARYEATIAAEARVLRGQTPAVEDAAEDLSDANVAIALPFPQAGLAGGGKIGFDVLSGESAAPARVALPEPSTDSEPAAIDRSNPFAAPVKPAVGAGAAESGAGEGTASQPAAGASGAGSSGGVFGGLWRAFGSKVPNPAAALPLPPGTPFGAPGEPEGPRPPQLDRNAPATPVGDDPFGNGN